MAIEKKSAGIKGGARPGAGRKKGSPNKKTAELQARIESSGLTPLDYMLNLMRSPAPKGASIAQQIAHADMRFEAAKAAAPYVHAKLASVEHRGPGEGGAHLINHVTRTIVDPGNGKP